MEERKRKSRNQMLTVAIALVTLAVVLIITYLIFFNGSDSTARQAWHLDGDGLLAFDARPPVDVTSKPVESTPEWTLENVSYQSFGAEVHALLRIPANVSKPPVVIVLPGATVNKEADAGMAKALASWGYATLTLDERGNNGETPGPFANDPNSGYNAFIDGGNPVQYEQVYDVLLGYDYVRSRGDLDGNEVAVLGESMGGRFAIVATALEPRLKAALVVSGGPYGLTGTDDDQARFIKSVEPAEYLSRLPSRELVMFHFTDDPIIPIASARQLYDAALPPKSWHEYNGSTHGIYSDIYANDLRDELTGVFGR